MTPSRLEERVRLALTPTPSEMDRMQARMQRSLRDEAARRDEVAWQTFSRLMAQSNRDRKRWMALAQAGVRAAVGGHNAGMPG